MSFFNRIELVPPAQGNGESLALTIPGSKSITNRALILAAQTSGTTVLHGALWSQDTRIMVEALQKLGFSIDISLDPGETCNRTISVKGMGGKVPEGGTRENPMEIHVGNAGTAARFLVAFLAAGKGVYRVSGVPRMHERPQKALFDCLRHLGYHIESANDFLPAVIHGSGARPGKVTVSIKESSQFASALLLMSEIGGWEIATDCAESDHLPYVEMTRQMIQSFPRKGGDYSIEPDASSASYFWAASHLLNLNLIIKNWPESDWQIDSRFPDFLPLPDSISRESDLGDSILTAIAMAPFADKPVAFHDLGRLRVQECERVLAMKTELTRLGVSIREQGDSLFVEPPHTHSALSGAEIDTYDDHRIAMSLALTGLRIPGVIIRDPQCVRKTFPNFFSKWSVPQPGGLGVTILDPSNNREIPPSDLTVT